MNVYRETSTSMRVFFCLEIPKKHTISLARQLACVENIGCGIKWTALQNLHITMKFCGEMQNETVSRIIEKFLAENKFCEFKLSISGIGGFPTLESPKIIWAGLKGDIDVLKDIQSMTENVCVSFGAAREKTFSPHITIARRKDGGLLPENALQKLRQITVNLPAWTVQETILMRSELTRRGSIYTPIERFKFNQAQ